MRSDGTVRVSRNAVVVISFASSCSFTCVLMHRGQVEKRTNVPVRACHCRCPRTLMRIDWCHCVLIYRLLTYTRACESACEDVSLKNHHDQHSRPTAALWSLYLLNRRHSVTFGVWQCPHLPTSYQCSTVLEPFGDVSRFPLSPACYVRRGRIGDDITSFGSGEPKRFYERLYFSSNAVMYRSATS